MKLTIPTREESARPSHRTILIPRNGQSFTIKISESQLKEYDKAKDRMYGLTNKNFSQSIIVRRSLAFYLKHLSSLNDAHALEEAAQLMAHR